jgi:hypothetical protein
MDRSHDQKERMLRTQAVRTAAFAVLAAAASAVVALRGGTSLGPISATISVPTRLDDALAAHPWTADLVLYRLLRRTFPAATYILPDEQTVSIAHLRRLAGAAAIEIDPAATLPEPDGQTIVARYFPTTYGPLELRDVKPVGVEADVRIVQGDHPGMSKQRVVVKKLDGALVFLPEEGSRP